MLYYNYLNKREFIVIVEYQELDLQSRMELAHLAHFIIANRDSQKHEIEYLQRDLPVSVAVPLVHIYVAKTHPSSTAPVAGCAMLTAHESLFGRKWWVENVLVAKSMRGRGIGAGLMKHLADCAQEMGVQKIHLVSTPPWTMPNRLYRSVGWIAASASVYELCL